MKRRAFILMGLLLGTSGGEGLCHANEAPSNASAITLQDYQEFLNQSATSDPFHWYDVKITSTLGSACMQRSGAVGSYRYEAEGGRLRAEGENQTEQEAGGGGLKAEGENQAEQEAGDGRLRAEGAEKNTASMNTASSPITFLSYNDAVQYCAWKNKISGLSLSPQPSVLSLSSSPQPSAFSLSSHSDEIDEDLKSSQLTFSLINNSASVHEACNPAVVATAGIDEVLEGILTAVFVTASVGTARGLDQQSMEQRSLDATTVANASARSLQREQLSDASADPLRMGLGRAFSMDRENLEDSENPQEQTKAVLLNSLLAPQDAITKKVTANKAALFQTEEESALAPIRLAPGAAKKSSFEELTGKLKPTWENSPSSIGLSASSPVAAETARLLSPSHRSTLNALESLLKIGSDEEKTSTPLTSTPLSQGTMPEPPLLLTQKSDSSHSSNESVRKSPTERQPSSDGSQGTLSSDEELHKNFPGLELDPLFALEDPLNARALSSQISPTAPLEMPSAQKNAEKSLEQIEQRAARSFEERKSDHTAQTAASALSALSGLSGGSGSSASSIPSGTIFAHELEPSAPPLAEEKEIPYEQRVLPRTGLTVAQCAKALQTFSEWRDEIEYYKRASEKVQDLSDYVAQRIKQAKKYYLYPNEQAVRERDEAIAQESQAKAYQNRSITKIENTGKYLNDLAKTFEALVPKIGNEVYPKFALINGSSEQQAKEAYRARRKIFDSGDGEKIESYLLHGHSPKEGLLESYLNRQAILNQHALFEKEDCWLDFSDPAKGPNFSTDSEELSYRADEAHADFMELALLEITKKLQNHFSKPITDLVERRPSLWIEGHPAEYYNKRNLIPFLEEDLITDAEIQARSAIFNPSNKQIFDSELNDARSYLHWAFGADTKITSDQNGVLSASEPHTRKYFLAQQFTFQNSGEWPVKLHDSDGKLVATFPSQRPAQQYANLFHQQSIKAASLLDQYRLMMLPSQERTQEVTRLQALSPAEHEAELFERAGITDWKLPTTPEELNVYILREEEKWKPPQATAQVSSSGSSYREWQEQQDKERKERERKENAWREINRTYARQERIKWYNNYNRKHAMK